MISTRYDKDHVKLGCESGHDTVRLGSQILSCQMYKLIFLKFP